MAASTVVILRIVGFLCTSSSIGLPCSIGVVACLLFAILMVRAFMGPRVYLVDFVCYRPADELQMTMKEFMYKSWMTGMFTDESLDFQRKILQRSGIGQESSFPPAINIVPANTCLLEAKKEAEDVMFRVLDELFTSTGVMPRQVGILVVNCSVFCPAPSLCAMVVNRFRMNSNVRAYNLGGMGCSAGIISLGLARDLLKLHGASYAVVVSTENITLNWYRGNDKPLLVSNCLFRLGGAAVLLSNRPADRRRSKYELRHVVRTNKAADSRSYYCIQQQEDSLGVTGVNLSQELMSVAASALRSNITTLGPLVLPLLEQVRFFISLVACKLRNGRKRNQAIYVPDFKLAFEHFCVHAGGRAVLDEVERSLALCPALMEPNRMTLYRFGNTSSSSLWYELAYLEAKGKIKKGDRVWQIGFGSGFKCNSAVWIALRDVRVRGNCWMDFIDLFPVLVPETEGW